MWTSWLTCLASYLRSIAKSVPASPIATLADTASTTYLARASPAGFPIGRRSALTLATPCTATALAFTVRERMVEVLDFSVWIDMSDGHLATFPFPAIADGLRE